MAGRRRNGIVAGTTTKHKHKGVVFEVFQEESPSSGYTYLMAWAMGLGTLARVGPWDADFSKAAVLAKAKAKITAGDAALQQAFVKSPGNWPGGKPLKLNPSAAAPGGRRRNAGCKHEDTEFMDGGRYCVACGKVWKGGAAPGGRRRNAGVWWASALGGRNTTAGPFKSVAEAKRYLLDGRHDHGPFRKYQYSRTAGGPIETEWVGDSYTITQSPKGPKRNSGVPWSTNTVGIKGISPQDLGLKRLNRGRTRRRNGEPPADLRVYISRVPGTPRADGSPNPRFQVMVQGSPHTAPVGYDEAQNTMGRMGISAARTWVWDSFTGQWIAPGEEFPGWHPGKQAWVGGGPKPAAPAKRTRKKNPAARKATAYGAVYRLTKRDLGRAEATLRDIKLLCEEHAGRKLRWRAATAAETTRLWFAPTAEAVYVSTDGEYEIQAHYGKRSL